MSRVNSPIPVRKLAAGNDAYTRGFHEGNPGGLDAVDVDLAVGNIADGVTIFGKLGTLAAGALAEDVEGSDPCTRVTFANSGTYWRDTVAPNTTVATKTLTFAAGSIAFAAGFMNGHNGGGKLRLYMGGVLMQTSAIFHGTDSRNIVLHDFKALSGVQTCYINTSVGVIYSYGKTTSSHVPAGIAVGSVKLA